MSDYNTIDPTNLLSLQAHKIESIQDVRATAKAPRVEQMMRKSLIDIEKSLSLHQNVAFIPTVFKGVCHG